MAMPLLSEHPQQEALISLHLTLINLFKVTLNLKVELKKPGIKSLRLIKRDNIF